MTAALTVQDLVALYDSDTPFLLLDVREPNEVAFCALPQALNIPLRQIPEQWQNLPTDRQIVVQCHHGGRSQQAVNFLQAQGLTQAVNLTGGIHAWSQEIDPEVPTY